MTKLQGQVKKWMEMAGQDCPEKPTIPDAQTRILRVRLLLEEVLELSKASGVSIGCNGEYDIDDMDMFDFYAKGEVDLVEVADALADINYVSYGAANAYGLNMEPFEECVHENNESKFVDGWIDEFGKFRKGPNYKPVDLKPILEKQKISNTSDIVNIHI